MDQNFKTWIVQRVNSGLDDLEIKRRIMRTLKFRPSEIRDYYAWFLPKLAIIYERETGIKVSQDLEKEPSEIVEAFKEFFAEELRRVKLKGVIFDFNRTLYDPDSGKLIPGALGLLEALKSSGYKLTLLCKKSASDRIELVNSLGLDKLFPHILLIEGNKQTLHIQHCLKRMQLEAHEVAVVGDRVEEEILAGNLAGTVTIWVKQGKFGLVEPTNDQQKPTHVVNNLQAIFNLV